MKPGLDALFAPRSIALIGASTKPQSLSQRMLRMMRAQLDGIGLTAVHPTATEIAGVRAVPRLSELAEGPDLVVVATPASAVVGALDEAIAAGARAAVICSSGFDETGSADGRRMRDELVARTDRIRIVGPNCQGLYHRPTGLVATFTPSIRDVALPAAAPIGYVGQSGAVGGALGDALRERGVALRSWASTGNQVDVDVVDIADHLVGTGEVSLLLLYLEDLPAGDRWNALCAKATAAGVRLAVLRGGRSSTGAQAIASHTGSLVQGAVGFDLVCARYGVVVADDIDDLADLAVVAAAMWAGGSGNAVRPVRQAGVAVLSSSGGAGALAADLASAAGLPLTELTGPTRERMARHLPAFASTRNPVDVTAQLFTGDPVAFGEVCAALADDPGVGAIVTVLSLVLDPAAEELARRFVAVTEKLDVPLVVVYLAAHDRTARARAVLRDGGLPVFDSVGRAMSALAAAGFAPGAGIATSRPGAAADPGSPADAASAGVGQESAVAAGSDSVSETLGAAVVSEASLPETSSDLSVLDEIGIPRPRVARVDAASDAVRVVADFGGAAVLKVGGSLSHKSELGAVRVGVPTGAAAAMFAELAAIAAGQGPGAWVEVHEMASRGVELLVSVLGARDGYPPLITVGWGGTLVELHRDTVTFPADLGTGEVAERCRTLRCWRLVEGWRGAPAHDGAAVLEIVSRLADWAIGQGSALRELEINPLIVHETGATAVDVVLGREER
jgi:acetate---CoA ligase (ADP-forming)